MSAPSLSPASGLRLLVPFAAASASECRAALRGLQLPNLQALLAEMGAESTDTGDDHDLSPPHERAQAQALGLVNASGRPWGDGQIPWAAAQSSEPAVPQAWFSPCHFQVGMEQVTLLPGDQLGLDDADSRPLFDALAPYCAEDGIALRYESATRWHASGEPLRNIVCASLDRVSGRPVDIWLAESPLNPAGSRLLKRLQSEAQMLFYTHPLHDARTAQGLLPVNGFWVSGAGALESPVPLQASPTVPDALRQSALRADWTAWRQAWAQLDAGTIRTLLPAVRQGAPVSLTLCGERHARCWVAAPRSTSARIGRLFRHLLGAEPAWKILETL